MRGTGYILLPVLGRRGDGKKLPCRLYRQRPYGAGSPGVHDKLCNDTG